HPYSSAPVYGWRGNAYRSSPDPVSTILPRYIPRQVRLVGRAGLEVDVEAQEVEKRELQVLGRRVVDVRDEPARVLALGGAVETRDIALDAPPAEPPDDRARDLVADRIAQDRRMSGARGDGCADS